MTTRAPAVLTISKINRKVQIYVVVSSWSLQRAPILLLGRIGFDFDRSSSWWQNLGNSTQNNMLNLLLLCENHGFPSSKCPFRLWYVCRLHLIHFDKQTDWQTCRACAKEILTLFWWDLLCNRTLSHFLGRTSKKTTLYNKEYKHTQKIREGSCRIYWCWLDHTLEFPMIYRLLFSSLSNIEIQVYTEICPSFQEYLYQPRCRSLMILISIEPFLH